MLIRQATTTVVPFFITVTGLSPAVTISKYNGSPQAVAAAMEVGAGWYKVELTSGETDTIGYMFLDCADGTGAHDVHEVMLHLPGDDTSPGMAAIATAMRGFGFHA